MTLKAVESLLNRAIGLDPASIGSGAIQRVVQGRMEACGLADAGAYLARLQSSKEELEELIEGVIVPETWFFRDRAPFALLGHHAASEWFPAHPGGVLRVLSVPCSTGEEPYSVAMTLLDAGLSPGQFRVDAVDISHRALRSARRAVYGKNSFRGGDLGFRGRHFAVRQDGYGLLPRVSEAVRFVQGNLLDSPFLAGRDLYDVIFCRNLLIYFDPRARERAVDTLDRLLKDSGLLFVGHAEMARMWTERFVSVRRSGAFAYRRRGLAQRVEAKQGVPRPVSRVMGQTPNDRAPGPVTRDSGFAPTRPASQEGLERETAPLFQDAPALPLEAATRLAGDGRMEAAAALCEAHLREKGADAQAYFLLGVIREALNDDDGAEAHLNRAIYLDPGHGEALLHLVLLMERRGDRAGAARLRRRMRRIQKA